MTAEISPQSMAEPPPSASPPPGWYPDPAELVDYRWWDGQTWTESTAAQTALDAGTAVAPPLTVVSTSTFGPTGPWLSETFRVSISRFGHFLPLILFFVLSVSIPTSYAIWYGLRDSVLTIDQATGATDLAYGGSQSWLIAALVGFPLSVILSFLAKGAVIRQTWSVIAERPELWSDSVSETLRRAGRIVPVSLGRTLLYWGLNALFVFSVFVVSPVFILAFPILVLVLTVIWVRFAFIGQVASLADLDEKPYRSSWKLSSISQLPLAGRLLLLAFVSLNMILAAGILGAPFVAIAGGGGEAAQGSAETFRLNGALGPNPSIFALGSMFNAIGLGASYVLSSVGTTLLYRRLGGPVVTEQADAAPTSDLAYPSA